MRTEEQFSRIHREALRFIKFHGKNVWVVPNEDNYQLSIIEPKASELPSATVALEVGLPIINGEYTVHSELPSLK